jgi:hypothetical protein
VLFLVSKEKTGFICDGQLLIYIVYSSEDFEDLWGGGLNEYKDFLLARQREFQQWQEEHFGAWIVLVPFDKHDYSDWLKKNPIRRYYRDKHASWALWVAQNPKHLENIRARHPLQHYILKDESLKALLFGWFLPVIVPNASSMRLLKRPLPQDLIYQIRQEIISQILQPLPDFRRTSYLRGSGVTILPGDRLVYPNVIDRISEQIEQSLITTQENTSPSYINISDSNHISINPYWCYPRIAILCLPLLILGCVFDCETVTVRLSRAECSDLPLKIWKDYFHNFDVELYPGRGADFAIAGFTKHIHNEIKRDLPLDKELSQPQRPEYIMRIK